QGHNGKNWIFGWCYRVLRVHRVLCVCSEREHGQVARPDRPRHRWRRSAGNVGRALRPPARGHRRPPREFQFLFSVGDVDHFEYPSHADSGALPTLTVNRADIMAWLVAWGGGTGLLLALLVAVGAFPEY